MYVAPAKFDSPAYLFHKNFPKFRLTMVCPHMNEQFRQIYKYIKNFTLLLIHA